MAILGLLAFGVVLIVVALSMFGSLVVPELDTAITAANSTTNTLTGTTQIMSMSGLIIFIVMVGIGVACFGAAAKMVIDRARGFFNGGPHY